MRFILLALVLLPFATVSAHETWIVPATFAAKVGEEVRLDVSTGMAFPAFETAVRAERIAKASYRLGKESVELKEFKAQDKSLAITKSFPKNGVATVWIDLKPRDIELSDEKVAEYLDEIGATADLRKTWAGQKGRIPWKETYTKHAKTFVAVGNVGEDRSWETPVAMKLELVPISDSFAAVVGKDFMVRLLADSKPVANAPIGLMSKSMKGRVFATTDTDGKATFTLRHSGAAMFFAVHLRFDKDAQRWHSDFTTLTFGIR
jgi:uncharacterized GH25 family protein